MSADPNTPATKRPQWGIYPAKWTKANVAVFHAALTAGERERALRMLTDAGWKIVDETPQSA